MALGLFTGIAALGVIAYRSVAERRQQIGMLRAIGYQTGSIALTFVLESGFIALMGILSGVVGGMIIARNLFTSGQFSGEGIQFAIPWAEVLLIVVTAFVVSHVHDLVAHPPGGTRPRRGSPALRIAAPTLRQARDRGASRGLFVVPESLRAIVNRRSSSAVEPAFRSVTRRLRRCM